MNDRITFTSFGTLGVIDADGGKPRYIDIDVPDQQSWQFGPVFADGHRTILLSIDGGKAWEGSARSRLWMFDLRRMDNPADGLIEIATENRPADYMPACALLPGEERLVVNPLIDGEQRVMTMNLDGSDQHQVTHAGDGFTYGVDVSPDSTRFAFHSIPPEGYRIVTCDLDGGNRTTIAGEEGHLYFGPTWSPDGRWIAYVDCHARIDPGHDWADIWVSTPDGSEQMAVAWGRRQWLSAAWGTQEWHAGGSNVPRWSPRENALTYCRASEGARPPWVFQPDRPDTDHFNRDLDMDQASGGTDVCLIDPDVGSTVPITQSGSRGMWDFRTEWSPDGSRIAFCRAMPGRPSELWIMDADGRNQHALTLGHEDRGADHPKWIPGD